MGMDYQINEEVIYKGEKAIIKNNHFNGYLTIEHNGKLKDVYYDEIKGQPPIEVELFGRVSYHQPGTISNSLLTRRNGGARHQFIDSIGGDSSNYR